MIEVSDIALGFALMLGLMFIGLHVGAVLFLLAVLGATMYINPAVLASLGNQIWVATDNYVLLAIPMFILLGELLVRSGCTDRIYSSLSTLLGGLPGGLLHTNIGASGLFSAVSGSSVATAATISRVALPEMKARNYDARMATGTIAAGATLGVLIPPSIIMIVYGAMTNTSVGRLYAAGVIPGLLLLVMFMLCVVVCSRIWPQMGHKATQWEKPTLAVRLRSVVELLPLLMLFVVVMGSIYLGWATPTEAAAVGVLGALIIVACYGALSVKLINVCLLSTIRMTAMIMFIMVTAACLNYILGITGVPQTLSSFVAEAGTSPLEIILALLIFYLILGCFLETMAMVIGTTPIVFPIIMSVGIDPVWFGVFLVILCEISLITPPTGMNLYVVQGIRGEGSIVDVMVGTIPFIITMLLLVAMIVGFPDLVLWLPRMSFG